MYHVVEDLLRKHKYYSACRLNQLGELGSHPERQTFFFWGGGESQEMTIKYLTELTRKSIIMIISYCKFAVL